MATILFEQIGGGETETPPPEGTCYGSLRLGGNIYADAGLAYLHGTLRLRMAGAGEGGEELEPPSIAIVEGSLQLLSGYIHGPLVAEPGECAGSLRLVGGFPDGSTAYDTDALCIGALGLSGTIVGTQNIGDGPGEIPPPAPDYDAVFLSDMVTVDAAALTLHWLRLASEMRLKIAVRPEWTAHTTMSDTLALSDQLAAIYRVLLEASISFDDTLEGDYTALIHMMDTLLLSGATTTAWEARALLIEAIAFGNLLSMAEVLTLLDSVSFADTIAHSYEGVAKLVDTVLFGAEQTATATFAVLMRDTVVFDGSVVAAAELMAALRDGVGFVGRVFTDTEEYVAWAMNTTTKGMTRYTNYPFNSFMTVGGNTYGIAAHGRFKLGGDDDDGAPINAKLRMGMSSLGNQKLKRVSEAYLGYAASGKLQLRVITTSQVDGLREAYVYTLHPKFADSPRESRIKTGQGLEAVYYDFELVNVDGADFDIDIVEIHSIPLSRRIRGNAGAKP